MQNHAMMTGQINTANILGMACGGQLSEASDSGGRVERSREPNEWR